MSRVNKFETNNMLSLNKNLIVFGIPLCLFGILIYVMSSSIFTGSELLSFAISLDLVLIVPFVYFMLIRKSEIPQTTVIPFMVVGLIIGSYFLPKENQIYLTVFKTWVLPMVELSILVFITIKVRLIITKYKSLKGSTPDFFAALKSTCYEILPKKIVLPFATEISVIYYGFIDWSTKKINENEFTYHKKSGTRALLVAMILIIGVEAAVFHLLLMRWSMLAAWVLTALSIYTAIQMIGFAKSLSKRPISINSKYLHLAYGIMNEVEILFGNIEEIEQSSISLPKDKLTRTLSPLGEFESHNIIIRLKSVHELVGIYGIKKKFKVIGFYVDEPEEFIEQLKNYLPST